MAVPFYIPDEEEATSSSNGESPSSSSPSNSVPNTPSRPISIPIQNDNLQSPQNSPQIDSEALVQAFYEALCRCSQEIPGFSISNLSTPNSLPSSPFSSASPFSRNHFVFPSVPHHLYSPSTSNVSSPRNSFRGLASRRRLNSHGSQSQHSQYIDDNFDENHENNFLEWERHYQQREQMQEFQGRVPSRVKAKINNQKTDKKVKEESKGKITNFVINALQYVIDSLR